MRFTFLFTIFFIFLTSICNAQIISDTLEDVEEVDTVVIYKEPVIIKKEIYISSPQKSFSKYINVFIASMYNFNYFKVCTSCAGFKDNMNNATSQRLNYSFGAGLYFNKRKLLYSLGITYTIMKEHFNPIRSGDSISTINKFQYLDLDFSLGYKLHRNKMMYVISVGGIASYLLNTNGKTFSETIDSSVVNLKSVTRFRSVSFSAMVGIKFIYKLNERVNMYTEPFYRGNILSITRPNSIYVQYRNLAGLRFGLFYSF